MTKEEADEKVREAKEAVIDALRPRPTPLSVYRHDDPVRLAWERLYEAEAARAALDKPRLSPYSTLTRRAREAFPVKNVECQIIDEARADILAQAEKLPRLSSEYKAGRYCDYSDAIFLSDLRNLINGAAA